ncbi:MAG: acyl carrier protein [Chitinivibrionales bacterium]|nr:acyl carrier protein [Chitinivibrionales bacterium]
MEALVEKLKTQIIESLKLSDVTTDEIDPDAPLIGEGLGLDSIDTLELLVLLEKEYGVTVPDVNVGRDVFKSVRSLAEYIEKNKPGE